MTGTRRFLVLAALFLGTLPASARAQATDADRARDVAIPDVRATHDSVGAAAASPEDVRLRTEGPALAAAGSGVRAPMAEQPARMDRGVALGAQRQRFSQAETLMIVGGVTFLAGAVIGDDAGTLIMIGGAAIGIYGLYLYLQ